MEPPESAAPAFRQAIGLVTAVIGCAWLVAGQPFGLVIVLTGAELVGRPE